MRSSKYDTYDNPAAENSIKDLLMSGELLIWSGKPKKDAFVLNKCFTMMPFALLWLCFDGFFIYTAASTGGIRKMLFFIVPFFAFHLLPVWIWLGNVVSANRRWRSTEYAVTDKRIIIRGGVIGYNFQNIYYTDIDSVDLHVGAIDRMLSVGDIMIRSRGTSVGMQNILDIENPYEIFKRIQKTVLDIQSDIHYPNDLRPGENHGYNTQYRP